MTEHPRPWTYRKAVHTDAFYVWDKNGEHVASLHDEPTARLIVDLVNADQVQRETGWCVRKFPCGGWGVCADDETQFGWADNIPNHGESPTPNAAILAAAAWLKQKG